MQPVFQQAAAAHIVRLEMSRPASSEECSSIASLSRLTSLTLRLKDTSLPNGAHVASSLTRLHGLQQLTLMAVSQEVAVTGLNLSSLTDLTRLVLENFAGSFCLAGSISNLHSLHVWSGYGRPDSTSLRSIQNLTQMTSLDILDTISFGLEELKALKHLPSLCQLHLCDQLYHIDRHQMTSFCQAVGQLTALTSLSVTDCM